MGPRRPHIRVLPLVWIFAIAEVAVLGRGLMFYRDRITFVNNHMPSETQTPYGDLLGPRDGPREFEGGK